MAIIENWPSVGLGRMLSPIVVEKQCCWVAVAILIPVSHEPDRLHGFMWLHTFKKPHSLHLASNIAIQMKHGSLSSYALFCMGSVKNLSPVWNLSGRTHVIFFRIISPSCWLLPAAVCDSREMLHEKWSQASAGHQGMVNWT